MDYSKIVCTHFLEGRCGYKKCKKMHICSYFINKKCHHGNKCFKAHVCRYYYLNGRCNKGDNCLFPHVQKPKICLKWMEGKDEKHKGKICPNGLSHHIPRDITRRRLISLLPKCAIMCSLLFSTRTKKKTEPHDQTHCPYFHGNSVELQKRYPVFKNVHCSSEYCYKKTGHAKPCQQNHSGWHCQFGHHSFTKIDQKTGETLHLTMHHNPQNPKKPDLIDPWHNCDCCPKEDYTWADSEELDEKDAHSKKDYEEMLKEQAENGDEVAKIKLERLHKIGIWE